MIIQLTPNQGCVSSGTLTINGHGDSLRDTGIDLNFRCRMHRPVQVYDYTPFAIIRTDHDTFMSIEALEHDENVYPTGKKVVSYCRKRLQKWIGAFEYMRPYKTKMTTVWRCVNHRPLNCESLLKKSREQK